MLRRGNLRLRESPARQNPGPSVQMERVPDDVHRLHVPRSWNPRHFLRRNRSIHEKTIFGNQHFVLCVLQC